MKIFYEFFSNFKFCRKKLGGVWFQVYREWNYYGIPEASIIWTRIKPPEYHYDDLVCEILKIENYNDNGKRKENT